MSDRPVEQSLRLPAAAILARIKEFDLAVTSRIESNAFTPDHIDEIHELSLKLVALRPELQKIVNENW
jgi:hypothetical protein